MELKRRENYRITGRSDAFIVPVLDQEISQFINSITFEGGVKKKVLDVGCGEQPFKMAFLKSGLEYYSLDIAQNKSNNVDYVCPIDQKFNNNLEALFNSFDVLFVTEVLEHVYNWDVAFENLHLLAKPKAQIFITTPFIFHPHEEPFDYWRPTSHAIHKASDQKGFKVILSKKVGTTWDVLGTILAASKISIKGKNPIDIFFSLILKTIVKLLEVILRKTTIHKNVNVNSLYYLSTISILEKK